MPSHVEEAEELLDREEDDGVKLEPFNLAQERAEGVFDESGHYVENKKDDAEETDAWLQSEDGEHHRTCQHDHTCTLHKLYNTVNRAGSGWSSQLIARALVHVYVWHAASPCPCTLPTACVVISVTSVLRPGTDKANQP